MDCAPQVDMFRLAALYVVERLREQLLAHIADMLKAACAAKVRPALVPCQPVLMLWGRCQGDDVQSADAQLLTQAALWRRQPRCGSAACNVLLQHGLATGSLTMCRSTSQELRPSSLTM